MDLIFQESPVVEIATNKFKNVPTIIQWNDTPLREVVSHEGAGFTTAFSIFNRDGLPIAKVNGARLVLTKDGENPI